MNFLVGEGKEQYTFQDVGHFERHAAWYLTRLRATKILHDATPSGVPGPPLFTPGLSTEDPGLRLDLTPSTLDSPH